MGFQTASGVTVAISLTPPATFDLTGWGALAANVVGEVTNVGKFGKQWSKVTHNPLDTRGTKKGKGTYDNGTLSPNLALDTSDAGQQDMMTARESDDPAYFIITLQDGTPYYIEGLVMEFSPNIGDGNNTVTAETMIEITDRDILQGATP